MNIINQKDPLMIKIESLKEEYEVEPVNAMLDHDTIIPGINGRQIDVLKSYEEMKSSGIFREELLVYKDLYPSSLLSNNKDKYIIKGNNKENKVSCFINSLYHKTITYLKLIFQLGSRQNQPPNFIYFP